MWNEHWNMLVCVACHTSSVGVNTWCSKATLIDLTNCWQCSAPAYATNTQTACWPNPVRLYLQDGSVNSRRARKRAHARANAEDINIAIQMPVHGHYWPARLFWQTPAQLSMAAYIVLQKNGPEYMAFHHHFHFRNTHDCDWNISKFLLSIPAALAEDGHIPILTAWMTDTAGPVQAEWDLKVHPINRACSQHHLVRTSIWKK